MAMNKREMATAIYAKLEAAYWPGTDLSADAKEEIIKYYEAVSDGQIEHMIAKMDVLPGTFANQGGNVTGTGKVK